MFKIFVGNLGQDVSLDDIRHLFERHATIEDIALPADETGKLRGFAIVMIKDPQQGRLALMAARGARLHGKMLIINQARKKGKAPPKRTSRRSGFRGRAGMYGARSDAPPRPGGYGGGGGPGSGRGPGPSPREGGDSRPFRPSNRPGGGDRGGGPMRPRDDRR